MAGLPRLIRVMGFGLSRPKNPVPGQDLAGVVDAVGGDVARFQPGDEVFGTTTGTWAEFARAKEDLLVPKPARLSFEEAAALPYGAGTALQAIRRGDVARGQSVLVIGASGAVGTYVVQMAKALGADVTGVAGPHSLGLVHDLGADLVIDYTQDDITSGGRAYDVVIDIAGRRSLSVLRQSLAPSGTLILVGGEGGGGWTGGFGRQMLRAPILSWFVGQELRGLSVKDDLETLLGVSELVEAGGVTPVVGGTCSLEDAPEAMRRLESGQVRGVMVLTV
jgi:NADPH:quinone reductase-like Zn-dependent oxidoreductase